MARFMNDAAQTRNPGLTVSLAGGLVTSIVSLVYGLSFSALLFSGELASGLPRGISSVLVGLAVTTLVVALLSAFRFAVAGPDSNAAAVSAGMVAVIGHELVRSVTPETAVINVLYMLAFTSCVTGVSLYLLGLARAGRWIRFVPYPVIGGFIASAGWLMAVGALRVISGESVSLATASTLIQGPVAYQIAAGFVWMIVLWSVLGRVTHYLALPLMLLAGTLACHAMLGVAGIGIDEARESGWLFAQSNGADLWFPWNAFDLALIEWGVIGEHIAGIGTVVVVTTLTILLNATGLELQTHTDADLDRELRVQGGANVAAAICGGFLGYLSFNRSMINYRMGANSRVAGIVVALVTVLFALFGIWTVSYLPKPVLGGLLLYLGLSLCYDWAVRSRRRMSRLDHLAILLIFLVILVWSFVHGVIVGIVVGCVMFVFNYSQVKVIKHSVCGREFRSSHERSQDELEVLRVHGEAIRIFVLQSFIFFGMADRMYRSVIEQAFAETAEKPRFLVFDFRLVHGIDSSAVSSFQKIAFAAHAAGTTIIATGLSAELQREFNGAEASDLKDIRIFADLDLGVEWCESQIIEAHPVEAHIEDNGVMPWLSRELGHAARAAELVAYLERRELAVNELLCRQNEPADEMYFIERGRVVIELELPGARTQRLRTLGRRTVLGEMGLYRASRRSASVRAEQPSVVYSLNRASIERMQAGNPALAALFNAAIVRTLANRLAFANSLVAALQR